MISKAIKSVKLKLIILISLFLCRYKWRILNVPKFKNPLVSIIIPVYNKFEYTYRCISSIIKSEENISYEIIIANDNSDDETKIIDKYIKNIIVINNQVKYNYLINCNRASKIAKGKYILFLNNDTKVLKDWLSSLVKLIQNDEKIGMVGSKFIYSNRKLQEAGGIVFNNGQCINYGNGDNPDYPQYNYVKEVDYISGASIMIKKDIWENLGGFDERFSPAYYEDTDFSFKLRSNGYKVLYQPKSVVLHYEGISNGKYLNTGIKKYQEINKIKFIEKWKNELINQQDTMNTFLAKDRVFNNNRILIIDHKVPNFDKDAGGRCTYMYLNLFKEIGFQVTFIGNDFKKYEPYTSILQQNGIEILYGKIFEKTIKEWLKTYLKYYKYVYLQRAEVTITYLDYILKYFSGKIIYFGHDLNYIRLQRQYNITKNINNLINSNRLEKIENYIISKANIVHVVGNYEENLIREKFKNKIVRNIPIYIFENEIKNVEKDFYQRKNIIFVGGFSHQPNEDGVLWFAKEIYPKIYNTYPEIIWYIVGSNVNDQIKNLESKNIKILGYLSDEKLKELYNECRIAIAPLRFGAGIKGKIIEAAYNQIPMVTTSIGAEGLNNATEAFIVEDDPLKFSDIICKLYTDFAKLKIMSDSGKIFIEKFFSKKKAKEIIMMDIN